MAAPCIGRAVAIAALMASPARAAPDECNQAEQACWTELFDHPAHPGLGLTAGSCTRYDDRVGLAGPCAEAIGAVDLPARDQWRYGFELGGGWLAGASPGYSEVGVRRSGGTHFYGVARALITYDVTRRLFMRGGPQLKVTEALGLPLLSGQGVFDVGTRLNGVNSRWELGFRLAAGVDGVASDVTPR